MADGSSRSENLREAVAGLDADVIGLQEVDRSQPRSGLADQTAVVAEALGARWFRFVPAVDGTPGETWTPSSADDGATTTGPTYGVGLVSRLPVLACHVRRFGPAPLGLPLYVPGNRGLTMVPDEPRVALAAVVESPRGPMTVITTHLSFVPGWNVKQLRDLVGWAASMPGPRVLMGDFNLPGAVPRVVSRWHQVLRGPTYPSWGPRVQLDHVLTDVPLPVTGARVQKLTVSDHCAAVVDIADE